MVVWHAGQVFLWLFGVQVRCSCGCLVCRSGVPVVVWCAGQVFLVYHNETKRAVLPNEVTSLDTVRALFVRSFPHSLSMRWFDAPSHKIYILDHTSGIFYELDDLRFAVLLQNEREWTVELLVFGSINGNNSVGRQHL